METEIISIAEAYKGKIKDNAIFFAPDIPPKKLKNALEVYAGDAVFEEVLVLIDSTVFGSAKEGALITDKKLYARNLWDNPLKFSWKEVESIVILEDEEKVQVNQINFLNTIFPEMNAMKLLVRMLNEILAVVHPDKVFVSETKEENIEETKKNKLRNNNDLAEINVTPLLAHYSPIDALRELKKLYDEGILTEEEYNLKRQKYLDLI
jgi:hypothetical protein